MNGKDQLQIKVLDPKGKVKGFEPVDEAITSSDVDPRLFTQVVHEHRANRRLGTAWVKDRSEVRGGGKKPWRQKGTGRARHGSIRSPIWKGGGVVFGPHGRKYAYHLPHGMKRQALRAGLKMKAEEGNLFLVNDFVSADGKTKTMAEWTGRIGLKKPLIIADQYDRKTYLSIRNLAHVRLTTAHEAGPLDVLAYHECVLTRTGYEKLLERLKS